MGTNFFTNEKENTLLEKIEGVELSFMEGKIQEKFHLFPFGRRHIGTNNTRQPPTPNRNIGL